MTTKISIIGAGSVVFSLNLIRDICLTPRLSGSEISLMDVDPARLEAVHQLCCRYATETGAQITATATMDRRESLRGADFVINTALVTGRDRLGVGWEIAARHGYRFGGSLHVMHDEPFWVNFYQLRFFEDVIQDILAMCPDAWYLQVANPVLAGITYLGRKYPRVKMVGLCHGFAGVYRIADILGLDRDGLTFEIPGVNHHVWLTRAYHEGKDLFPLLDHWIEQDAPAYWETCPPSDDLGPQAIDLYRRFGAFPIGDTCTPGGGSWPWWYHTDAATEQRWHEDPAGWWQKYFEEGKRRIEAIERAAQDESIPMTQRFPPVLSGEIMIPLIESIVCDIPRVLIGNILNLGEFVPGIPGDFAVEIPILVSKRGIEGIRTLGLPPAILAHIWRDRIAPVVLELEAYEAGSRELLLQLILMDPWTRTVEQARSLLEEVFAMPGHEDLRTHYT